MKKKISLALTLVMLCALLAACGGHSPDSNPSGGGAAGLTSSEELDEITHRLLVDWYGYIVRCEYLYGDMQWALSYLDPFFEDHSWSSLQIARAAMDLARRETEAAAVPLEPQMTFDDYDKLTRSGADVSAVQLAVNSLQSLTDAVSLDYHVLRDCLNSPAEEFFLTYELSYFENWASLMGQMYDIQLRNCAVETDYLLLSIDNGESEARFIEAIAANCPQINTRREGNPQDQDALMTQLTQQTDELEMLVGELSDVTGQARANLELFRDMADLDPADSNMDNVKESISAIAADAVDLKDFPTALPYPDWWYERDSETFMYVWNKKSHGEGGEDEQTLLIPTPGDIIETPPDQYLVKWSDVPKDAYLSYMLQIQKDPDIAENLRKGKEGDAYLAYCETASVSFSLIWEENEVSLMSDGSVCLAPYWYFYLQCTS